jgi:hypothetical protein
MQKLPEGLNCRAGFATGKTGSITACGGMNYPCRKPPNFQIRYGISMAGTPLALFRQRRGSLASAAGWLPMRPTFFHI